MNTAADGRVEFQSALELYDDLEAILARIRSYQSSGSEYNHMPYRIVNDEGLERHTTRAYYQIILNSTWKYARALTGVLDAAELVLKCYKLAADPDTANIHIVAHEKLWETAYRAYYSCRPRVDSLERLHKVISSRNRYMLQTIPRSDTAKHADAIERAQNIATVALKGLSMTLKLSEALRVVARSTREMQDDST